MRHGVRRWVAWGACLAAIAMFVAGVVIPAAQNPATNGFATCYAESRILLERPGELRRIYDDDWFQGEVDRALGRHVVEIAQGQPPSMSFILAPLAWLTPGAARLVWIVVSALLWVGGLALLADTLALGSLLGVPPIVWLTAASTAYLPIHENLERGQGYALLFFLLCLVVRSLVRPRRRPRGWAAGIPLGLMVALKSAGLWLYPLLLAARQPRLLAGALGAVAAVVVASAALAGWAVWPIYLRSTSHFLATEPSNHDSAYQTVQSLTGHLFIGDRTWNPAPVAHLPALARVLSVLIIGALFAISVRRQRLAAAELAPRALSVAMFVAPIVAVAPIGEGYHYTLLFPAVVIAFWWAFRGPGTASSRERLLVVVSTALLCVPQRCYGAGALQRGWAVLLAYPRVYGALGLWGVLAHALGAVRVVARSATAVPAAEAAPVEAAGADAPVPARAEVGGADAKPRMRIPGESRAIATPDPLELDRARGRSARPRRRRSGPRPRS